MSVNHPRRKVFRNYRSCLIRISGALSVCLVEVAAASPPASFDCAIYPSAEANISSYSPGILEQIHADRSNFVNQGDALAVLDSSAELSAVILAEARVEAASEVEFRRTSADHSKRQLNRFEKLSPAGSISSQDYDDRRTEVELGRIQLQQALDSQKILELELARARVSLAQRTIRSPISGVVVERYKSAGEYVDDQPIVKVANIDTLHVETILSTDLIGKVWPGMPARVWSEAMPNVQWTAYVDQVDAIVDIASGTFGVRLVLDNPDAAIVAGIRCQLEFDTNYDPAATTQSNKVAHLSGYHNFSRYKAQLSSLPNADVSLAVVEPIVAAAQAKTERPMASMNNEAIDSLNKGETVTEMQRCFESQEFSDQHLAEKYAALQTNRSFNTRIATQKKRKQVGYLVRSPLLQSLERAEDYAKTLEANGIQDFLVPKSETPLRVSIGAFRDSALAESMINRLGKYGIQAESAPWKKNFTTYTVVAVDSDVQLCD